MADLYATGIPGLDEVMLGGFIEGHSVMIEGYTGTGKTVLGMALIHAGISALGQPGVIASFEQLPQSLYRDALSLGWDLRALERQDKLRVLFVSPATLVEEISAQISHIGDLIAAIGARRLFLDGINMIETVERDPFRRRQLIDQVIAAFRREGLNVSFSREKPEAAPLGATPESYIADTVIQLTYVQQHGRRIRYLEVTKSRGQDTLNGLHTFKIHSGGVSVYPRQKAPVIQPQPMAYAEDRATFGLAPLDEMLGGGLFRQSATLVGGSSGTGKTLLCLQFLVHGARQGEPGLFVTLEEPAEQIAATARNLYPEIDRLLADGILQILALLPLETDINEQIIRVREAIGAGRVKRLAFDSLSNYEDLLPEVEYKEYMYALVAFVKGSRVTAVFTQEIRELTQVRTATSYGTSYLLDNIIMLRFVELSNALRRAIVVLKTRGSSHAGDIREYVIARTGIQIIPLDPNVVVPVLSIQEYSHILTPFPVASEPPPGEERRRGRGGQDHNESE
ncbi:MAG: hypothetical protein HY331_12215 [Chloroflexi bacterium]|nr:hypothetical protein [Chloroflexota bacterium]